MPEKEGKSWGSSLPPSIMGVSPPPDIGIMWNKKLTVDSYTYSDGGLVPQSHDLEYYAVLWPVLNAISIP